MSNDLISRSAVIKDIQDLLKSPYALGEIGNISGDLSFRIRKDVAETIIDTCVKDKPTVYSMQNVIEQLEHKIELKEKQIVDPPQDLLNEAVNNVANIFIDAYKDAIKIIRSTPPETLTIHLDTVAIQNTIKLSQADRDYWKAEAQRNAAKLGEIRILLDSI